MYCIWIHNLLKIINNDWDVFYLAKWHCFVLSYPIFPLFLSRFSMLYSDKIPWALTDWLLFPPLRHCQILVTCAGVKSRSKYLGRCIILFIGKHACLKFSSELSHHYQWFIDDARSMHEDYSASEYLYSSLLLPARIASCLMLTSLANGAILSYLVGGLSIQEYSQH